MTELSFVLLRQPIVDKNGLVSRPWREWFEQLFQRVGGAYALTNADLEAAIGGVPFAEDTARVTQIDRQRADDALLQAFAPAPIAQDTSTLLLGLFDAVPHLAQQELTIEGAMQHDAIALVAGMQQALHDIAILGAFAQ